MRDGERMREEGRVAESASEREGQSPSSEFKRKPFVGEF